MMMVSQSSVVIYLNIRKCPRRKTARQSYHTVEPRNTDRQRFGGLNLPIHAAGRVAATPSRPPLRSVCKKGAQSEPDQPVASSPNDSELVRALKSANTEGLNAACRNRNQLSKKRLEGHSLACVAARNGLSNGLRTLDGEGASLEEDAARSTNLLSPKAELQGR